MAVINIPDENRAIADTQEMTEYLSGIGIHYERWPACEVVEAGATAEEVLDAYREEIDRLKARGGYVTADVIDVGPQTPGLDAMLAKFSREHWHDEDEVRFIISGRGLFHIRPGSGPVFAIEVRAGDLISVPRGTLHWFNLCADRRVRAIRLFQDPAGWAPNYTESGADAGYEAVCLGPSYIPARAV